MNTLEQIAELSMKINNNRQYYLEPRTIAKNAVNNGCDCEHVKNIAVQHYPQNMSIVRGNQIRCGLISYARVNKGVNDEH